MLKAFFEAADFRPNSDEIITLLSNSTVYTRESWNNMFPAVQLYMEEKEKEANFTVSEANMASIKVIVILWTQCHMFQSDFDREYCH